MSKEKTSAPDIKKEETVELTVPVVRGEVVFKTLTLNKPNTRNLRGVSLVDVLKLDVDSIVILAQRCTMPPLAEHEARNLDPADVLKIGVKLQSFFVDPSTEETN